VQVSTGGRARTVSRARKVHDVCRQVLVYDLGRISLDGRHLAKQGRLVLRGDTWRFVYTPDHNGD
jgi:hypothetical protein